MSVGFCSSGSFDLNISYSPPTATTNLITIGSEVFSENTKTVIIYFADSQNANDENTYTIDVEARYSGQSTKLTSDTETYEYKGCSQTSI